MSITFLKYAKVIYHTKMLLVFTDENQKQAGLGKLFRAER